eukprot:TRINITY_DN120281_c1_g1_i1.p1 TRINITY_DN120281_c1_g1~~TRINITY_DN120281_c1_g1_i1.p1  ORF type:complete len:1363 (+),score=134.99 TRINITY_DN120281_c1_g1_i1:148-4236(+)
MENNSYNLYTQKNQQQMTLGIQRGEVSDEIEPFLEELVSYKQALSIQKHSELVTPLELFNPPANTFTTAFSPFLPSIVRFKPLYFGDKQAFKVTLNNGSKYLLKRVFAESSHTDLLTELYNEFHTTLVLEQITCKVPKIIDIQQAVRKDGTIVAEYLSEYTGKSLTQLMRRTELLENVQIVSQLIYIFDVLQSVDHTEVTSDNFVWDKAKRELKVLGIKRSSKPSKEQDLIGFGKIVLALLLHPHKKRLNFDPEKDLEILEKIKGKLAKIGEGKWSSIFTECFKDSSIISFKDIYSAFAEHIDEESIKKVYKAYGMIDKKRQKELLKLAMKSNLTDERLQALIWIKEKVLRDYSNKFKSGQLYYVIGYANQKSGRYQKAIENYHKALEGSYTSTELYTNIGESLIELGEHELAIEYYKKAINMQSVEVKSIELAKAYEKFGTACTNLGIYPIAVLYFETVLNICKEEEISNLSVQLLINIYNELGWYALALECYKRAVRIDITRWTERENPELFGSIYNCFGTMCISFGNYKDALEKLLHSEMIVKKWLGTIHPLLIKVYLNLGHCYRNLAKHKYAAVCYKQALALSKQIYGSIHWYETEIYAYISLITETYENTKEYLIRAEGCLHAYTNCISKANTLINLATAYYFIGDFRRSIERSSASLSELQMVFNCTTHPLFAEACNVMGNSLAKLYKHKEALAYFIEAKKIAKIFYPQDHPIFASIYSGLVEAYIGTGEYAEGSKLLETVLKMINGKYNQEPYYIIQAYLNLGRVYQTLAEVKDSYKFYKRANKAIKRRYGFKHPLLSIARQAKGTIWAEIGNYRKAKKLFKKIGGNYNNMEGLGYLYNELGKYEKVVELFNEIEDEDKVNEMMLCMTYIQLGVAYKVLGEFEKSEQLFIEAWVTVQGLYGNIHPLIALACSKLAELYQYQNKCTEAIECANATIKAAVPDHPLQAVAYKILGVIYLKMGEPDKATKYLEQATEIYIAKYGEDHPHLAEIHNYAGTAYITMKDYAKAVVKLKEALRVGLKGYGENCPLLILIYNNLGKLYLILEKYKESIRLLRKGWDLYKKNYGEVNTELKRIIASNMEKAYEKGGELTDAAQWRKHAKTISKAINETQLLDKANSKLQNEDSETNASSEKAVAKETQEQEKKSLESIPYDSEKRTNQEPIQATEKNNKILKQSRRKDMQYHIPLIELSIPLKYYLANYCKSQLIIYSKLQLIHALLKYFQYIMQFTCIRTAIDQSKWLSEQPFNPSLGNRMVPILKLLVQFPTKFFICLDIGLIYRNNIFLPSNATQEFLSPVIGLEAALRNHQSQPQHQYLWVSLLVSYVEVLVYCTKSFRREVFLADNKESREYDSQVKYE